MPSLDDNSVDIGQAGEAGLMAGLETFFRSIFGQFQETQAGQQIVSGIDQYTFRRMLPWLIVGGVGIYLLAKD